MTSLFDKLVYIPRESLFYRIRFYPEFNFGFQEDFLSIGLTVRRGLTDKFDKGSKFSPL